MQSNQNKKSKTGFTGMKILIGALSLTGTFGIWGLISNKAVQAANPPQDPGNSGQQDPNSIAMNLPPMPTLVPIQDTTGLQNGSQQIVNIQPQTLRQVSQPTPVPVIINNQPVFQRLTINRPGNSGGSSSGSSR
jgi:hypothetical protein